MAEDRAGPNPESDLLALIGAGPVPFPARDPRDFAAWHRPRKQYVRTHQWARELLFLARDLKLDGGELRYLTLPGPDLLDVRHVHDTVCKSRKITLRYLGFNRAARAADEDQPVLNSAEFSIKRLPHVDRESRVVAGDFCDIGDERTDSWLQVRRSRTFHAINLDLCGGFAGRSKSPGVPSHFTALHWLLQTQSAASQDFLLFITTRMDPDSVDDATRALLDSLIHRIHGTCAGYADAVNTAWGSSGESTGACPAAALDPPVGFMLGLTQWIVACGIRHGLRASVRSFMSYRTGTGTGDDDIVSIAIRFKPDPVLADDPAGLAQPLREPAPPEEKECVQSTPVPAKVKQRVLVDEVLRTDAAAFDQCLKESLALLGASGYDEAAYQEWVESEGHLYARPET